jgi:hypothetical protein
VGINLEIRPIEFRIPRFAFRVSHSAFKGAFGHPVRRRLVRAVEMCHISPHSDAVKLSSIFEETFYEDDV